jgi:hypothetical protein
MRRLLFALLLLPALASAAPFSVTVDRGYIGPREFDLTDKLPAPSGAAVATLTIYAATPFTRAASGDAIRTTGCATPGSVACLMFNLEAGDTYYPGTYYAEIMTACHNAGNSECVYAGNGATVRVSDAAMHSGGTAIHIGPNGSYTTITAAGTIIDPQYNRDVWVESATGLLYFIGGATDPTKHVKVDGGQIIGSWSDTSHNRFYASNSEVLFGVIAAILERDDVVHVNAARERGEAELLGRFPTADAAGERTRLAQGPLQPRCDLRVPLYWHRVPRSRGAA